MSSLQIYQKRNEVSAGGNNTMNLRILRRNYRNFDQKVQYWILAKLVKKNLIEIDVLEEYCIDNDILHDYYNEPNE